MKIAQKIGLLLILLLATTTPVLADSDSSRTANRTVGGSLFYPDRLMARPQHDQFLPRHSNTDMQKQHPMSATGSDWDSAAWPKNWGGGTALKKLFRGRVFERQYMRGGVMPVVELGPTFWQLSDLDQRRSLKLLADESHVFESGYTSIELVDWKGSRVLGVYTSAGMVLN